MLADGHPSRGSSKPSSTSSGTQEEQITSPVPFSQQNEESSQLGYDPGPQLQEQSQQVSAVSSNSLAQQQPPQGQPQHFIFGQQQPVNMPNPYFLSNTGGGQDPYSQQGGIPMLNANAI